MARLPAGETCQKEWQTAELNIRGWLDHSVQF